MEILRNLAPCRVPEEDYKKQKKNVDQIMSEWKESVRPEYLQGLEYSDVTGYMPKNIYLASDENWRDVPFGAANDMEHSGCIVFVAKLLLDYYQIQTSVLGLKDLIVESGYRAWRFENSSKNFFTPRATLEEALQVLPSSVDKSKIKSLEEAIPYTGEPIGVGGMHILLDNIIAEYSGVEPVLKTRLRNVCEVLWNLALDRMVPMLVDNSVYKNSPREKGRHFVILVSVRDQMATVIDSSIGYHKIPITQLLEATTVAWNVPPRKRRDHQ